jgi:hypothetical protein
VRYRRFDIEEEAMLKTLLGSAVLALSACSTTPQVQSGGFSEPMPRMQYGGSFGLGPTNVRDPRFLDPHFYMDNDATPRWLLMTPQPNR